MPVLLPTQFVVQKRLALDEPYRDFAAVLPTMRALRVRVDWHQVRRVGGDDTFAVAPCSTCSSDAMSSRLSDMAGGTTLTHLLSSVAAG
jgi:hypothetical protein